MRWTTIGIEEAIAGLPDVSIVSGATTTHRVYRQVDVKSSHKELEQDVTRAVVVAVATLGTFLAATVRTVQIAVPLSAAEASELERRPSRVMVGLLVGVVIFFATFGVFWYLLQTMDASSSTPAAVGIVGALIAVGVALTALALGRPRYALFSVDGTRLVIMGHADFVSATRSHFDR